ncbi:MAG: dynamin family protein [Deltaproteobacteria bacterium]|nr:dynamin family protein [Deltaproteobacteria bacterium]
MKAISPADLLQETRHQTELFLKWFSEEKTQAASRTYPREIQRWRKEVESIAESLRQERPTTQIALVGTTGAGKSTLLNAILGRVVLPVGVMEPCTAFVTSVRHSTRQGGSVHVEFCSREDWRREVEAYVESQSPGESDVGTTEGGETTAIATVARKRIEAVTGKTLAEIGDPKNLLQIDLPEEVERALSSDRGAEQYFESTNELHEYVKGLVHAEKSSLWPLVNRVEISGSFPCLAGGIELVDLPGLNDPNEARIDVTRKYLRHAPFIWLVFSMKRSMTKDIQEILVDGKMLRRLVFSGRAGAFALIGTHADEIDFDVAPQFGLPDDLSTRTELIQKYRETWKRKARKQLDELVRGLPARDDERETISRLAGEFKNAKVHAVSANAYMKLEKIGRLRKDYGIEDPNDTGIPGIHSQLNQIALAADGVQSSRAAIERLRHLKEEIEQFFRARARPKAAQAREHIDKRVASFSTAVDTVHHDGKQQLKFEHTRFVEKMDPIFEKTVREVNRAVDGWRTIHWATLRAIAQRDGCFRSPSTGKTYDLNEDLAEPLLDQLPVAFEKYFTDDLGRVSHDFVVKLGESGKSFGEGAQLVIGIVLDAKDETLVSQVRWFEEKLAHVSEEAKSKLKAAVDARRRELDDSLPATARDHMQPAYKKARLEQGPGLKARMLALLQSCALKAAGPIYSSMKVDLLQNLDELDRTVAAMFHQLSENAHKLARTVAHNANIGAEEAIG